MVSGFKILLRGSLLGSFIRYATNERVLGYNFKLTDIDPKYFEKGRSDSSIEDKKDDSTKEELIIVEFDGPDDLENPHNWPVWVKIFIGSTIGLLACFTYISSVIYFSSRNELMEEFGINETESVLPLTLFVIAYGLGPLIFSPLSEHPKIGRNLTYVIPLIIFFIMQIPTSLVTNFAGLCVLRFISGFMISPVLATGGASFADLFKIAYLPIAMCNWGVGATSGIALGPLFGQALEVSTHDWRWSFWALLIISGFLSFLFITLIPETYPKAILYKKAQRLRRLTGNSNIVFDIDEKSHDFSKETIIEILWRPVVIGLTEPVILMINLYIGVLYAILYVWFECLPIVFYNVHGFSLMATSTVYMAMLVGCLIGSGIYDFVLYKTYTIPMLNNEKIYPEVFTPVAMFGSIMLPIGIFITGWTSTESINWFVPVIGVTCLGVSAIILFQTLLNYIAMSFPRYVASAFSSNAFARSVLAGCFPLFGKQLFLNLKNDKFPVGYGSTILGVISSILVGVTVTFYFYGAKLRATSKYSR